ncbi:MAG: 23S rRNA pseudouridine(1911/1915/1917) synthase RluD [Gammaproteobacteria bacterium]
MTEAEQLSAEIPQAMSGRRLDQALAELFPRYSRSRIQQWIRAGSVTVDGQPGRPRDRLAGGEQVVLEPTAGAVTEICLPQAIPLDIVFEDGALLVIHKPAGLVVHPAVGNREGTLQNALLHHAPELAALPRGGLVHRLDKDTSGLLVVARTLPAHKSLVDQIQARTVEREYDALTHGVMTAGGTVDLPVGRHPVDRKRMAVVPTGRRAVTHYRVRERFRTHTWARVRLETGRTHQIRVHMAKLRFPLVGDPVYGGRLRIPPRASEALQEALRGFGRQALHAGRLALVHPETGARVEWQAPLPADMAALIALLRADAQREAPEP